MQIWIGFDHFHSSSNHHFYQNSYFSHFVHWKKSELFSKVETIVADPDPHISETSSWIRILNFSISGSGIIVPVPDPAKNECADKNLIFNFLNNL